MSNRLPIFYSFRRCPYAMRARLAIAASGVQVELREVVLKAKPAELLQASPKGTVPVLISGDGTVIAESLDIMLWALRQHDPEGWLTPDADTLEHMLALIAGCDGEFKHHLDRYKYPERYAGADALQHRAAGAAFLEQLNDRLCSRPTLYGPRHALADMAIAPFVRQYAQTDAPWFAQQAWPRLADWLHNIISSERFVGIMDKYPPWTAGVAGPCFPQDKR